LIDAGIGRYKNQNVAIKIVHKGDTPEEMVKREGRFLREVTMLSRVQHKNLVKVLIFLLTLIISFLGVAVVDAFEC
jgi:serine/threonine protein kinase